MKAEQLRKSILQLAIQGKLVKQDPNDEPASVLLERIRAEKQRLIKEGKIKKDKGDSIIFKGDDNCHYEKIGSSVKNIDDEIPFEIPDTWCWVRLSHLSFVSAGGTPERSNPKYWQDGNIPWLKISDVTSSNKYVRKCSEYITEEGMNNSSAKILPKGTILYTIFATIGEVGILDFNATCNQAIAGIQTFNTEINDYLYYYLVNLQDFMKSISKGCAQFNINQKILKSAFVPLPPLQEQQRIVKEIERFESLLTEYDNLEQQATKLDSEIYDKLKKSILQYAIQGKLVPQDENDESASVLLERIRAEKKAQLGKKYVESYIYKGDDNCYYEKIGSIVKKIDDEIPFDIPDSWQWCRLKELVYILTDGTHNTPKYTTSGVPFISVKDVSSGKISFSNTKFISVEEHNELSKRCNPQRGDILLTKVGTTGIPVLIDCDEEFSLFVSVALLKFFNTYISAQYFIYLLKSPLVQLQAKENTRGVGNKNWVLSDIENTLLVLPPLQEQQRIVEKITFIFSKLKDEN